MSRHRNPTVDEARRGSRFGKDPDVEVAVIFRPQHEQLLVSVHDESLTGLGLYLDDLEDLAIGEEVDILYESEFLRGCVRHIERQPDGRFVVGFSCERLLSEPKREQHHDDNWTAE